MRKKRKSKTSTEGASANRPLRAYIITSIIMATLIAIAYWSFPARMAMKFFSSILAPAASFAKLYMLLAFVMISCLVLILGWRPSKRLGTRAAWTMLFAIAGVSALGMISHVWLVQEMDIPFFDYSYMVREGEGTSTSFNHIHTLKPIIQYIGWLVPGGLGETYDHGIGADGLIPTWIIAPTAILYLMIILSYIIVLLAREESWRKEGLLHRIPLLIIVAFMVTKSLIDGGIFTYESLIGIPILAWLSFARTPRLGWKKATISALILFVYSSAIVALISKFVFPVDLPIKILYFIAPGASLIGLVAFMYWFPHAIAKKRTASMVFSFVFIVLVLLMTLQGLKMYHDITFLFRDVSAGQTVRMVSDHEIEGMTAIYDDDIKYLYETTMTKDITRGELVDHYRLNPSRYPVDVIGEDCVRDSVKRVGLSIRIVEASEDVKRGVLGPSPNEQFLNVTYFEFCDPAICDHYLIVERHGCLPAEKHILGSFLSAIGYKQYIMISS
ncbi:MAG: hypothetical protein ABIC95_04185 [archaeon]